MALYADTPNATAYYSFFSFDTDWQAENDRFVVFARRMLGGSLLQTEITNQDIWQCLETALLKYGQVLNENKTKFDAVYFLGLKPQNDIRYELVQPAPNFNFIDQFMQSVSAGAGLAGNFESKLCYVTLEAWKQDYDLKTDLYGPDATLLFDSLDSSQYNRIRIMNVFHFPPWIAYRFFNSNSLLNFLNNEFRFESFTPETLFYVLPIADDILRMGMMQLSNKVRRSNYSYEITGRTLRIFPMPTASQAINGLGKLFMRVSILPTALDDGASFGGSENGNTITGPSTLPFKNLVYQDIANDAGKNWIREYALAECKRLLGYHRRKYKQGVPLADRDIQLDGEEFVAEAKEKQDLLETKLVELLDAMSTNSVFTRQLEQADNLKKYLELIPIPPKALFRIG